MPRCRTNHSSSPSALANQASELGRSLSVTGRVMDAGDVVLRHGRIAIGVGQRVGAITAGVVRLGVGEAVGQEAGRLERRAWVAAPGTRLAGSGWIAAPCADRGDREAE